MKIENKVYVYEYSNRGDEVMSDGVFATEGMKLKLY